MSPGENLLIARTANGFMVTGVGDGDGKTVVSEAFVFQKVGDTYSMSGSLIEFVRDHFEKRVVAGEEA